MNEFIEVLSNKEKNVTPIKSTAYVSLCVSTSAVDLPALYSFLQRDSETNETIPLQFPRCFLLLLREKLFEKNVSL